MKQVHGTFLPSAAKLFRIVSELLCLVLLFMAQQVLTGSQKRGKKKCERILCIFLKWSGISNPLKPVRNYWTELCRFLGLQWLYKKLQWCMGCVVAEGSWETALSQIKNCFCNWGCIAAVGKPLSWKGLLLLCESGTCCFCSLASGPDVSGEENWDVSAQTLSTPKDNPGKLREVICKVKRQNIRDVFYLFKTEAACLVFEQSDLQQHFAVATPCWRCII